jgi:hypothetical protein
MTQTQALAIRSEDRELQAVTQRFGGLLTGNQAQEEKIKLVALVNLGFDPRLGHLAIFEGRVTITLPGGAWWKNHEDPQRRFGVICEVVKKADREDHGLTEDEIGVIAFVEDHTQINPVTVQYARVAQGFGKASTRPYTYRAPKQGDPQAVWDAAKSHPDRKRNPIDATHTFAMAQKRAEGQAIKRGFPTGVDVDIRPQEDAPPTIITVENPGAGTTDPPPDDGARAWPNDGAFLQDVFNDFALGKSEALAILGSKTLPKSDERQAAYFTLKAAHDAKLSAELDAQAASEAAQ